MIAGILLLLVMPFVLAVPGIPHQFYGSVLVNGQPAPDNNVITAFVQGDDYITVTKDGKYGYSPNIFYVEDPNGDRSGELIQFYVGGKKADSYVFENNGYTQLNFDLTTTCGDGYCLGDETCSSCPNDCGICTNPPEITISSPEQDKVYETTKIDLIVTADQEILLWMYSLDDADAITFTPDITLTLSEGTHELTVIGMSKENYLTGQRTVTFNVDVPVCGDDLCEGSESCSNCPADCGTCNTGGGGGGGSSGGGGGSSTTNNNEETAVATTSSSNEAEETSEEGINPETIENNEGSGITGAVTGVLSGGLGLGILIFIAIIIIIAVAVYFERKKKK